MKRLPTDLPTTRLAYHIGVKCGQEAREAGGPYPYDADGKSILPTDPLPADYEHIIDVLNRKLTIDEASEFIEGWQRGFRNA